MALSDSQLRNGMELCDAVQIVESSETVVSIVSEQLRIVSTDCGPYDLCPLRRAFRTACLRRPQKQTENNRWTDFSHTENWSLRRKHVEDLMMEKLEASVKEVQDPWRVKIFKAWNRRKQGLYRTAQLSNSSCICLYKPPALILTKSHAKKIF